MAVGCFRGLVSGRRGLARYPKDPFYATHFSTQSGSNGSAAREFSPAASRVQRPMITESDSSQSLAKWSSIDRFSTTRTCTFEVGFDGVWRHPEIVAYSGNIRRTPVEFKLFSIFGLRILFFMYYYSSILVFLWRKKTYFHSTLLGCGPRRAAVP